MSFGLQNSAVEQIQRNSPACVSKDSSKKTMAKVREAIEHPYREEEIRQIAYHLWLDEGCPHGRHLDHWFKAESIWREQEAAKQPADRRPAKSEPETKNYGRRATQQKPGRQNQDRWQ